jgi:hypothetical protein
MKLTANEEIMQPKRRDQHSYSSVHHKREMGGREGGYWRVPKKVRQVSSWDQKELASSNAYSTPPIGAPNAEEPQRIGSSLPLIAFCSYSSLCGMICDPCEGAYRQRCPRRRPRR